MYMYGACFVQFHIPPLVLSQIITTYITTGICLSSAHTLVLVLVIGRYTIIIMYMYGLLCTIPFSSLGSLTPFTSSCKPCMIIHLPPTVLNSFSHSFSLKFPAVFIIYGTGSATVFDVFVLIGYMNRRLFFCSSRIAVESYANATPFCSFIGQFV